MDIGSLRVSVGMDSAQFQQGVGRVQNASKTLQREFSATEEAARKAGSAVDNMEGASSGATSTIQNIAFQIGDFATQVGAGTDALRAAGMQLPQLLGSFGALGAVLGAVAAVAVPLASYFLSAGDAAEESKHEVGALAASVDAYVQAAGRARATPLQISEDYGVGIQQAQRLLDVRAELARVSATADLRTEAAAVGALTGQWQRHADQGLGNALERMGDLVQKYDELRAAAVAAQDAGDTAEFFRLTDAMKDIDAQRGVFTVINDDLTDLARLLGIETASAAQDLARALASVDDSADPMVQAQAWERVQEALLQAVDGAELLNDEGRQLLQHAIDAQDATLRVAAATGEVRDTVAEMEERVRQMLGLDLAGPFERAWESVDRLVGRMEQGLISLQGWGTAVGSWLESFNPGELGNRLDGFTDGIKASMALLREVEGFQPVGTWDVNAYRAGYGSDTVTLSDGTIQAITQGMAVNRADAERDLERRAREFAAVAMREVGADRWADILPAQQAVLTSLAYNYGNLPDAVAAAVRSGSDMDVGRAIVGLGGDNGGVNRNRRNNEAAIYAAGVGAVADAEFRQAEAARAAEEATRDADTARREAERSAREQAQLTERASSAFDQLVASIDPAAAEAQQYAEAQETINNAIARGVISVTEGAAALEAFNRHQMENSEAAKAMRAAQEEATEEISSIWENATDDMADYFADGLMNGFEDGIDGAIDILKDGLRQMIAIALRNRIFIPIQTGIQAAMGGGALPGMGPGSGLLGGIGSAIGGAMSGLMGGAGSVLGGLMTGGLGGAAGAIGTALSGATAGLGGLATAVGALAVPVMAVVALFSLFRKKTEVLDHGIKMTINGFDAMVETFRKTRTTRLFGLIRNTDTDFDAAAPDVANPIIDAYRDVYNSVSGMASDLGLSTDALKNFSHEFKLSLDGLTDEQKAAALQAEFEKIADGLARTAGVTGRYIRVGESASQALERLTNDLAAANGAMAALGHDLYDVSIQGAHAASGFVKLFGSLEQFTSAMEFYHTNFYSLSERAQEAARQFQAGMQDIGLNSIPRTEEAFRAMVDRLMENGNTRMAAEMIQLAPLFQQMLALREEANGPAAEAGPSYADRLEAARRAAGEVDADKFGSNFRYQLAMANEAQKALKPERPRTALSDEDRALLRSVRDETAALREQDRQLGMQLVTNTHRTARVLERQDVDGQPPVRT